MFTGIVEELGEVVAVAGTGAGRSEPTVGSARLVVRGPQTAAGARPGDSVAVNGVCLTVTDLDGDTFVADVMPQTLGRSSLGVLRAGQRVNLERPVQPAGRLGGHLVQGHVDATGTILERAGAEGFELVTVSLSGELARYLVAQGSVTVDGVSLTVVGVGPTSFTVGLVPATLAATTLGRAQPGDPVNLEVDIVAKYVEKLLQPPA